ncbi:MAG: class I SAM-dependent rRNA methyltransferase [Rhodospirillales bacterium]
MAKYPLVGLRRGEERRLRAGHPWAFSNEIDMNPATKELEPGSVVALTTAGGDRLGLATFNPHSLIGARLLASDIETPIDAAFFAGRFQRATALRDRLIGKPFYRLAHAEADGLPGLIVDRFGDVIAVQANTAGMDKLLPQIVEALQTTLQPRAIVVKNDSPVRGLEGLGQSVDVVHGTVDEPIAVEEYGAKFNADLVGGQKTGWFYDQRDNRHIVGRLAQDARVLDLYCYAGGFAVQAALGGAREVLAVDRSEGALALATQSAAANNVDSRLRTEKAEVFEALEKMIAAKEQFDIVVADPPAFVKSRKDIKVGTQGYRKLARLSAQLVAPGGLLFIASCSHLMEAPLFADAVRHGLADFRRTARVLYSLGAAPDHPVHPALPESAYLKAQLLQLD